MHRLIHGLGIRNVGLETAKDLEKEFSGINVFIDIGLFYLCIPGILNHLYRGLPILLALPRFKEWYR